MRITRYPQSCLKIAKDGLPILVDVGTMATADGGVEAFGKVEAVVFTHRHSDHLDVQAARDFLAAGVPVYGNADVAEAIGSHDVEVIDDGEELVIADFKFKAFKMDHCLMVDGSPGVPNTAFLVDDRLLLPGDSTDSGAVRADIVAVPVFGPDISLHDAYRLLEATQAKVAIPVHYDIAQLNPAVFEKLGGKYHPSLRIKIIQSGQTIEA